MSKSQDPCYVLADDYVRSFSTGCLPFPLPFFLPPSFALDLRELLAERLGVGMVVAPIVLYLNDQ